jgi:hypothetical protein
MSPITTKRLKDAREQVITEARAIHQRGYGRGTTFGLGTAFVELDAAEQELADGAVPFTGEVEVVPTNREGFWREMQITSVLNPLPWPKSHEWKSAQNRQYVLYRLRTLEASRRPAKTLYKGTSICRLCHLGAGNGEYAYKGWVWPAGLLHYIEVHGICPSKEFREFLKRCEKERGE